MGISALGDQPLSTAARWISSPDERGTFNVLSDCILTLVLCVQEYTIGCWGGFGPAEVLRRLNGDAL